MDNIKEILALTDPEQHTDPFKKCKGNTFGLSCNANLPPDSDYELCPFCSMLELNMMHHRQFIEDMKRKLEESKHG